MWVMVNMVARFLPAPLKSAKWSQLTAPGCLTRNVEAGRQVSHNLFALCRTQNLCRSKESS
jgi:hypothetical protein